jgi:hypothetical protein
MEERRIIFMKKNVLIKGILALLLIALLTIGFSGCGTITPPLTGIVNITLVSAMVLGKIMPIDYTYDIKMDGNLMGTTNTSGNLTIANVTVGLHTFETFSNFGTGYGYTTQNISSGINSVNILVPPILI